VVSDNERDGVQDEEVEKDLVRLWVEESVKEETEMVLDNVLVLVSVGDNVDEEVNEVVCKWLVDNVNVSEPLVDTDGV
jgi:hypothetical protein